MTVASTLFRFEDSYAREVPGLSVPWTAAPAPAPELLVLNEELAVELGVDPAELREPSGVALLVGQAPEGVTTVAQAYAGHQFGVYSPRLGDGRALLLGEVIDIQGRRRDLHLKGSGRTPFSRGADGKAVVGPMLREYVIGEAMHGLGIPTTRALAVVATGERVIRERALPGAVLTRVAASHLRVGTFQYAAASGDRDLLRALADYAIARHYPEAAGAPNRYLDLYRRVVRGAGAAGGPVDAGRVRPRGDEHRQHDDFRRDHRLRPVRVHGRLRPGHGVQLHRRARPLRLRQPAAGSCSGTWPGWRRPCCRCSTTTARPRLRRPRRC